MRNEAIDASVCMSDEAVGASYANKITAVDSVQYIVTAASL